MTYDEAVAWLYSTQLFGIKLGLENMRALCAALGIDTSERPVYLHVAGTNGKGSVCAMLDSILRASGRRAGLYTSPHLVTFRERIRLNGDMISEGDAAAGLTRIREVVEGWEQAPTFFEVATALALAWFAEQRAEVAVLETGLGGRLDATNVVTPAVSVLTRIGLDHEKFLGSTVGQIAVEKAGIIKPGVPVVSAPQELEVREIIETTAAERGCTCEFVEEPWMRSPVGLAGSHQRLNAALARAALAPLRVADADVEAGLARVVWPGRFQRVGERIVLDGAHNPAAAQRLALTWREEFGDARATLVLGVMRDKDVRGVCAALAPIAARVFAVHVDNARSCSAEELAETVRAVAPDVECAAFPQLSPALTAAERHPERVLIAGSLFLVGEAFVALRLADATPEVSAQ